MEFVNTSQYNNVVFLNKICFITYGKNVFARKKV